MNGARKAVPEATSKDLVEASVATEARAVDAALRAPTPSARVNAALNCSLMLLPLSSYRMKLANIWLLEVRSQIFV